MSANPIVESHDVAKDFSTSLLKRRKDVIGIRASKGEENLAILVEVKGFEGMPSPIEYLASATGKYAMYRAALDYLKIDLPLYMAVPDAAYRGILSV